MSFIEYPSIDNHYREKEISMWLNYHPELANETFIAREKLDGSNLALWFMPDGKIKVASRSNFIGYLGDDVRFQGADITKLFESTELYKGLVLGFRTWAMDSQSTYIVFGELFGTGIQNRVNYGPGKQFRAFDVMVDEKMISQRDFERMFVTLFGAKFIDILCPLVGTFDSLAEALECDVEFESKLTPEGYEKKNVTEGVVLKPYNTAYVSPQGSIFYLKKKNPKFKDNEAKPKKEKAPVDAGLAEMNAAFCEYINENRVLDVFSKHGAIEKPSQIGEYIRYVLDDAKKDFMKDYPDYKGDKNDDKIVFNVGSKIVDILKGKM